MAQLFFAVQVFHQIGLVDDVDQVNELGRSPKHLAYTEAQFEIVVQIEVGEFTNVKMRAFGIRAVLAVERGEGKTTAVLKLVVILRLQDE